MIKRLFAALGICAVLAITTSVAVFAQGPEPADEVKTFLTAKGYTVGEVDYVPDQQGNPRPDAVFVVMDTVTGDLDSDDMASQAIWGFIALHKYYPRADTLMSALVYKQFAIFFSSSSRDLDRFLKKETSGDTYWNSVRSRVRIYDLDKKVFVGEKDFIDKNQTDKNQTDKDFGKNPPNPVPTPVPAAPGKGESLLLEPSTTYLPADGTTNAVLIATLRDANFVPLVNRQVNFSYEVPGEDANDIGPQTTDTNGTARAAVKSDQEFGSTLLRASTESLNSQVSIVVGSSVTSKSAQVAAVVEGLTTQGYTDVDANYISQAGATGKTVNIGLAEMRMASKTFDRAVYSQMSRAFGTLRTVFPKTNTMGVYLIYRKDGQDLALLWNTSATNWEQFVAGKISENDFWRNVEYYGAWDEKGNRIGDKNFIDKNFGAGGGGKEARLTRQLESTVTKETWGEQWHGQEFVILPGSYADTFALTDLSGDATAIQIFQAPDFVTPILTFQRGDDPDDLKNWRLGQGQYLFAVVASSAPATARMTYIEHLPQ